ncbi:MAG: tRNA pseudouridine(55) synthase TruB [Acidobacteria bacterium]|nr:tRNA pseudouridine(55) synthase TruB [Acidobacteriota bacterium]
MDGAIVVDKPEGWTSHDVVNKVRRLAGIRKVGHLGTLDPIATGVLPLLIGRATRLAQYYSRSDKIYDAVIRFGFATSTYDRAGEPVGPAVEPEIDPRALEAEMAKLRGQILQKPPPVSAKKIAGERAYTLVRRQVAFELEPVKVRVYELRLTEFRGSEARVWARCSAGTYMRAIAHDLGQALGCGAHLKDLRRLGSGDFAIEQAHTLPELEELAAAGKLEQAMIPAAKLLPEFPAVFVDDVLAGQIRQGRSFPVSPFRVPKGARFVKAVSREGELIAIGQAKLPTLYHPVVVL